MTRSDISKLLGSLLSSSAATGFVGGAFAVTAAACTRVGKSDCGLFLSYYDLFMSTSVWLYILVV